MTCDHCQTALRDREGTERHNPDTGETITLCGACERAQWPDIHVQWAGGHLAVVHAQTEASAQWLHAHLPPDGLRWVHGWAVEARYLDPILTGLEEAGFTLEFDPQ